MRCNVCGTFVTEDAGNADDRPPCPICGARSRFLEYRVTGMGPSAWTKVYLDTSIIIGITKDDLDERQSRALREVLEQQAQYRLLVVTSMAAGDEIAPPREDDSRLVAWIYPLIAKVQRSNKDIGTCPPEHLDANTDMRHPTLARLETILPGKADAEHLFQAFMCGARYFMTVDKKTILRYATKIETVCLVRARDPVELLNELKAR